jgi:hypothetical protein
MAGEWIQYDVGLPRKPETLALVDATGLERATVCGRLQELWGWASLNSLDGTVRITVRLLAMAVGGDEAFWYAVQDVGWLVIDAENGTVAIPGWDRRFSKAAKTRAMHSIRADDARSRTGECAKAHGPVRGCAPERRERGERNSSSSPVTAAQGDPEQGDWEALRKAWKAGKGRPWNLPDPPDKAADRLAEPGWYAKALAAIEALPRCRYFRDPVTLTQLVEPGWVDKILGGQFDNPRDHAPPRGGFRGQEDRPPAQAWSGSDAAAFEATKRKLADQIRSQEAAT